MALVRRKSASAQAAIGFSLARCTAMVLGLYLGVVSAGPPRADAGPPSKTRRNPYQADTSRFARAAAVRSIPMEKLDAAGRKKVASVLSHPHIFRRLPMHVTQCDPDLYLFLVRHPDVMVNIWRELGVSGLTMRQIGPQRYRSGDDEGMLGTIEFLYSNHDTHVIYVEGRYEGPLFSRPVRGRSLIILKTGYVREPDGHHYIASRLDSFTHIENVGVDLLTRTFQPLVGKVADRNFTQTSAFLGSLSRTAEMNPRGVQRLAERLDEVQPENRKQLAVLARRIADRTTRPASHQAPSIPGVAQRSSAGPSRVVR